MRDVAHLAGVSHQTVSRVVNDHPSVRSETRARVLAAMRALDYQPNVAARTLATNRSQTVGLVTFDTTLFGPSFMVHAIERAAREAGYFVSIASARELNVPSVSEAIRRLREQAVEGIITLAPVAAAWTALGRSLLDVPAHVPIVGMGIDSHAMPEVPMVAVDNAAGAGLATRHLIALGHRTVHHVAAHPNGRRPASGWPAGRPRSRTPGCRCRRAARRLERRSGYAAGRALAADPAVTAVFCGNDQMAIGVLRAMHEAGRAVPGAVSVVGFDDMPEAPYLQPPLTTVRQDFAELGRRSMHLLVTQIAAGVRQTGQHRSAPTSSCVKAPPSCFLITLTNNVSRKGNDLEAFTERHRRRHPAAGARRLRREGRPAATPEAADSGATLTLWTRAATESVSKAYAAAYNATHKNQVQVTAYPNEEYPAKLASAAGAKALPDLFASDVVFAPQYASQGLWLDITDQFNALPFKDKVAPAHVAGGHLGQARTTRCRTPSTCR